MVFYLGSDHAGYELKQIIHEYLTNKGHVVHDVGPFSGESVDYPDYVHPIAQNILSADIFGILICGSGNGVCMTANKYPHIRAGIAWEPELAALMRKHNNANILCLPSRFISKEIALNCVIEFVNSTFEGGRHLNRVDKITPKFMLK